MKAPANTEMMTSAALDGGSILAGRFPKRTNTALADVLMHLLEGDRLTVMESVISSSTTRLPARVEYLGKKYCWFIPREDKAQGCKDGRVANVKVYWLLPSTIAEANKAGAAVWCLVCQCSRRSLEASRQSSRGQAQSRHHQRRPHEAPR